MASQKLTLSIGHALVKTGKLTPEQLKLILSSSRKTGNRVKDILIQRGLISETQLEDMFAKKLNVPALSLHNIEINPNITKLIPYEIAEKCSAVPLFLFGDVLTVVTDDPLDYDSLNTIANHTKKNIRPAFATLSEIKEALGRYQRNATPE